MRVLLLGGTGPIGGPIVRELTRRGHDVMARARSHNDSTRHLLTPKSSAKTRSPRRWVNGDEVTRSTNSSAVTKHGAV
jgi:nucleoside-diphosphate-sugar epimerase